MIPTEMCSSTMFEFPKVTSTDDRASPSGSSNDNSYGSASETLNSESSEYTGGKFIQCSKKNVATSYLNLSTRH